MKKSHSIGAMADLSLSFAKPWRQKKTINNKDSYLFNLREGSSPVSRTASDDGESVDSLDFNPTGPYTSRFCVNEVWV